MPAFFSIVIDFISLLRGMVCIPSRLPEPSERKHTHTQTNAQKIAATLPSGVGYGTPKRTQASLPMTKLEDHFINPGRRGEDVCSPERQLSDVVSLLSLAITRLLPATPWHTSQLLLSYNYVYLGCGRGPDVKGDYPMLPV